uniref:Putative DNA polymerase n=1 Tax=viral metagenome TaxID=1070528 RepID=A0A6M3L575_9ZZZZ
MNQPLHLKYRPKTFDEFVGNKPVIESLRSVFMRKEGKPHSFLFVGPSGCGKTTLARIVGKELGCEDRDFIEYNSANLRGIDTVREMIQQSRFFPLGGKVKTYLLDEVHQVTKDAQNALLKLLEEPPDHVYLMLTTTEPEKLIGTIRNRCVVHEVKKLLSRDLEYLLVKVLKEEGVGDFPEEAVKEIIKLSDGCPRRCLVYLDAVIDIENIELLMKAIQELDVSESKVIDLCRAIYEGKWEKIKGVLKELEEEPEKVRYAILGYFNSVFINSEVKREILPTMKSELDRYSKIISCFEQSFMYGGKAMLTNSCYLASKV